ncbi:DUF6176 family protein [Halorussus halophilus]|uniref:DUF6176 family protein n=1 Tax=Halorussus halophilus TaxID=2650975 RepID=UPI001300DAF3|nr:DUF6176 family protein [Halorussus halophilus]
MVEPMLYALPIDPEKVGRLREYFEALSDETDLFERGLELEGMFSEAAWLDDSGDDPTLYYYMEASDDYPPDMDLSDIEDDELVELNREHQLLFETVCTEGAELRELDQLFFASTLDRNE